MSIEPRRRLTVEALGLVLIALCVVLALVFVFVLTRNTADPEAHASGIEGMLSLAAVLVGALAGYLGRGLVAGPPVLEEPDEADEGTP